MPFVEVKQSGPDIPDGVYPLLLTEINGDPENPNAPRHVVPESGPNANKDLYFWDWKFAIDSPGHPLDATPIEYGTSTATGPRSKMYGLLTALLNGTRPSVGMKFEKTDLVGRRVLGTIQRDEAGYCRITNVSAMPASMQQQGFAQATGAPTQGTPVAAPAPVAPPQPAAVGAASPAPEPAPAAAAPAQPVSVAPAAPQPLQPQPIVPPMPQGWQPGQPVAAPATTGDDLPF